MRIPWYLSALLMISSVGITWYVRTKDMNFFPEEMPAPAVTAEAEIKPSEPKEPFGPPAPAPLAEELLLESNIVPGLDAHSHLAKDTETLRRFFSIKLAENQVEDAYLAGERLMESPDLVNGEKKALAEKLAQLLPEVSSWVYDEREVRTATLELIGVPYEENLRQSLETEIGETFYESSGGMITLSISYALGDTPSATLSIGETLNFTNSVSEPVTHDSIIASLYPVMAGVISTKYPTLSLPIYTTATKTEFTTSLTRLGWAKLLSEVPLATKQREEETPEED